MADSKMTRAERDELSKLLKARARLANRVVEQRATELMAEVERQLATKYRIDAAAWEDLTAAAVQAVKNADAELAQQCHALGIPEEFRPALHISWWDRGENADSKRRAELRRVAQTRIAAMAKQARVAIETKALDALTMLTAGALESARARELLASVPTVEMLMPALDVSALRPFELAARPKLDLACEVEDGIREQ